MFAMVILTFVVLGLMFSARVRAIRSREMSMKYFKTYSEGAPTPYVLATQRHFANLFEVPVLFYAGCLAAMFMNMSGPVMLFWAWLFVGARVAHAFIHLSSNSILPRMTAYFVGCVAVLAMWLHLGWAVFSASQVAS